MQTNWNNTCNNKLKHVKPIITKTILPGITLRKDESCLHRLRLGHTYLTHKHLLLGEMTPDCSFCNAPLTVEHILLQCKNYDRERAIYLSKAVSLYQLFQTVKPTEIIQFIKQTRLYTLI